MPTSTPGMPGWYPDPESGGTRYWEGSRWTGDVRPPRRSFAAQASSRDAGIAALFFGGFFVVMSMFSSGLNDGSVPTVGLFFGLFGVGLAGVAGGTYLLRGRGPTTEEVEARLKQEAKQARSKRRAANVAGFVAGFQRRSTPASAPSEESAAAAQVSALANPETATALQNLQKLLYTRALTQAEFDAAKARLVDRPKVDDPFEQVEKLAELHRAGILGDVEFSAAKARVLNF